MALKLHCAPIVMVRGRPIGNAPIPRVPEDCSRQPPGQAAGNDIAQFVGSVNKEAPR